MATSVESARAHLEEGWRVLRPAWGMSLLAVVVWGLLTNVAATLCFLPLLVVGGPLTGGLYLFFAKRLFGLPGEVGDLFLGFRRFVPTTVVYLVVTLVFFVVLVVLAAPMGVLDLLGVIDTEDPEAMPAVAQVVVGGWALITLLFATTAAGVVLTFGMPLALFDPSPGVGGRVLAATRAHLGRVVALNVAGTLVAVAATIAGLLLCLVGVLVLQPVAVGVVIVAQLALVRDAGGLDASKLAPFLPAAAPPPA